jgi:hypothetical protein
VGRESVKLNAINAINIGAFDDGAEMSLNRIQRHLARSILIAIGEYEN